MAVSTPTTLMPDGRRPDDIIRKAVSAISLRAEYHPEFAHLTHVFVDPGITDQIMNTNPQIIYGRRGTGKTHVLTLLRESLTRKRAGQLALYINLETLGSIALLTRPDRPLQRRITLLYRDLLSRIHDEILAFATDPDIEIPGRGFEALTCFADALRRTVLIDTKQTTTKSEEDSTKHRANVGVSLAPTLGAQLSVGSESSRTGSTETGVSGRVEDDVHFLEVVQALSETLHECGMTRLCLLLDEWSRVPLDLQPWLADFIRRSLLPTGKISVKIAAVEYRARFSEQLDRRHNVLGFELSGDIFTALNLDEQYVWARRRKQMTDLFARILYSHLRSESGNVSGIENYLGTRHGITDATACVRRLFAGSRAFPELVRAGGGVPRDFLTVFTKAFFRAAQARRETIDAAAVREAGTEHYEDSKVLNVGEDEEKILRLLLGECVGRRGHAIFLVSKRIETHPVLESLVDYRLLHPVERSYRPDAMGLEAPFNVYSFDYGAYAHLMGTERAPLLSTSDARAGAAFFIADRLFG